MKESKKRDSTTSKKKKHGKGNSVTLESWDQTDLEDADEKMLEKRLHQLKMQLEMDQDEGSHESKRLPNKYKKKYTSEDFMSSDSDSSDSDSSLSSTSSVSVRKYKSKKSSSISEDDGRKYSRSPLSRKKFSKDLKNSRTGRSERDSILNSKSDKKFISRKKTSPMSDKYSRKKSPSLDRREVYSRLDTGRWHEKAKEFTKERNKREVEHEKIHARNRIEHNRSSSPVRESRIAPRTKEDRITKKLVNRGTNSNAIRRKDSPESSRARVSYDAARRTNLNRKLSPREERTGRHDERRIDLKVARRKDNRLDTRDMNLRVARDIRDRKEPLPKLPEKTREREIINKTHRDVVEHSCLERDRNRVNDDRFKDRDKRLQERIEPERNIHNLSYGGRELMEDKFRRNDRTVEMNRGGGVFDRMRNRYNDRRNAENNQRLGRDRLMLDVKKDRIADKEVMKARVDVNGADKTIRIRRMITTQVQGKSPIPRDHKEPERNVEKRSRSPLDAERKFPSPLNSRKARDLENRVTVKRKSQETDDVQWNKKKMPNEVRSRSRSSERKRRRSSQEEWRVIDMTSPVLDDEFSDENNGMYENNAQNKPRRVSNEVMHVLKNADNYNLETTGRHKPMLTDELSDISDEDFGDINANNNAFKFRKTSLPKNDRFSKPDQIDCNHDQKSVDDREKVNESKEADVDVKNKANYVDDLIDGEKLQNTDGDGVNFEKCADELDSEEDTVSRVSDALGVDWIDLVEESKKKNLNSIDSPFSISKRWSANSIFARIGVSEKYAGEELFSEIQRNIDEDKDTCEARSGDEEKICHKVASLHVYLKNKLLKRRTLFEPYKTAISARKDITLRRRLCGLPVKSLRTQQIIGICHWIV